MINIVSIKISITHIREAQRFLLSRLRSWTNTQRNRGESNVYWEMSSKSQVHPEAGDLPDTLSIIVKKPCLPGSVCPSRADRPRRSKLVFLVLLEGEPWVLVSKTTQSRHTGVTFEEGVRIRLPAQEGVCLLFEQQSKDSTRSRSAWKPIPDPCFHWTTDRISQKM